MQKWGQFRNLIKFLELATQETFIFILRSIILSAEQFGPREERRVEEEVKFGVGLKI